MSMSIYLIENELERTLDIRIEEEVIAHVSYEEHGWMGLELAKKLVKEIAETFNISVYNLEPEEIEENG